MTNKNTSRQQTDTYYIIANIQKYKWKKNISKSNKLTKIAIRYVSANVQHSKKASLLKGCLPGKQG